MMSGVMMRGAAGETIRGGSVISLGAGALRNRAVRARRAGACTEDGPGQGQGVAQLGAGGEAGEAVGDDSEEAGGGMAEHRLGGMGRGGPWTGRSRRLVCGA